MNVTVIEENLETVEAALEAYINKFDSQAEAAESLNVSRVFLWKILNRKKTIPATMLEKLGFRKEVVRHNIYKKKDNL